MNSDEINTGSGYWLAWFLMSMLGFGLGAILGAGAAYRLFDGDPFGSLMGATLGTVMGATGGYLQWVVLRERIAGAGLWTLASALGLGLAMGPTTVIDIGENYAMSWLLVGSVFGVAGGLLQWLILRRKVPRAGWWLFANLLGSLVGAIAIPIAAAISETGNWGLAVMAFGLVFGVGNGAVTGAALVWLLRQSHSNVTESLPAAL